MPDPRFVPVRLDPAGRLPPGYRSDRLRAWRIRGPPARRARLHPGESSARLIPDPTSSSSPPQRPLLARSPPRHSLLHVPAVWVRRSGALGGPDLLARRQAEVARGVQGGVVRRGAIVEFTPGATTEIARMAHERGTGAVHGSRSPASPDPIALPLGSGHQPCKG